MKKPDIRAGVQYTAPKYYDIAFNMFRGLECEFLEGCFKKHAAGPVRRVLDIACGTGPHLLRLAARGYEMTGLDLSTENLAYVRNRAEKSGLKVELVQADMTDFDLGAPFDAAMCLQDSQGHLLTNEQILAWDHLSHAGFINGTYTCAGAAESSTTTPVNPYAVRLQLIYDGVYGITSGGATRHNLKTGAQIPVEILAEVDRKIDDGAPYTGAFQFSAYQGNAAAAPTEGAAAAPACTSGNTTAAVWNATNGSTNCGGASLF